VDCGSLLPLSHPQPAAEYCPGQQAGLNPKRQQAAALQRLRPMPFDPTKPANNSPASSAEMRSQLTSLNADIQQRATINDLNNAIANALAQTSNNSNGVGTLGMGADGSYNQSQMQDVLNKLDELINALRR